MRIFTLLFCLLFASPVFAGSLQFTWDHNDHVPEGYRIFQRVDGTEYDLPVWSGTDNTAILENVPNGIQYYFVVRAFEGDLESGNSNEVNFTFPPNAPANFMVKIHVEVFIESP